MEDRAAKVDALFGAQDDMCNAQDSMCDLHAPSERVLFSELRNTVVAMCAFVEEYAADFRSRGGTATAG
ncbi:hypothetical protein OG601_06665 [Streptomyces sp. NBC_01239]|uniref:hypothetical protein n=1 Tax=Streptomyces sp. NBC_01239 TaxID=2903792 RepID=UPI00225BEA5B|nr:hypothetical protein [Streptomyces sp. NBC_01239]MCX4810300.1 hypothetical protein [Streptomyces sp. NBC_01239]